MRPVWGRARAGVPQLRGGERAGDRFCGPAALALVDGVAPARVAARAPAVVAGAVPERRLVSILFADLVGFTTLSEHRDPEEVRELLSDYFERCRSLIERFGGTVGKFIGDAVMAVWGTPVAREDDAERAVQRPCRSPRRSASSQTRSGCRISESGSASLPAPPRSRSAPRRRGWSRGRRQHREPASVHRRPGDGSRRRVTRRASEASIAYEDAGLHQVKGRDQPVHAWTALWFVAVLVARAAAPASRSRSGRDAELRTIIDAGDDKAHASRARHVAVLGEPGSGKSRLVWELFKYVDGLEEERYWHHGGSLSYGEEVAYWALAEMVRTRAKIAEEDQPAVAREKLHVTVERFVPDERERRLVEPRLAHRLRLEALGR